MKKIFLYLLTTAGLLTACQSTGDQPPEETADLILTNGKIATVKGSERFVEAVAVKDGEILETGTSEAVLQYKSEATEVIDVNGRTVVPGLHDSHLHAVRGGRFYNLELRWDGVTSLKEGLRMIKEQAGRTPEGQWVRVIGGWSPFQFEEKRFPTVEELNEAAPNTPVFVLFLYSRGFLNQAGLEALGVDENTPAPKGTRYELGPDGKPTGVLLAEPNPTILYQTIGQLPQMSREDMENSTIHFYRELNRLGLTSASDAGGGGHLFPKDYVGTKQLADNGEMPVRVSYYLFPQRPNQELEDFRNWIKENATMENFARNLRNGYMLIGGGEFLAWSAGDFENFLAPRPELDDRPNWRLQLKNVATLLVENRWPFRIHATYGESVTQILDVLEQVDREVGFDGLRWALDHVETIKEEDLKRLKAMGGGVSVQSRMAYAGEFFVERYGAEAAEAAPPIKKIMEMGIPLGVGTDGTRVSSYNPWNALYWMVSGKTVGGMALYPQANRLSRDEALHLYTAGSAWFSADEDLKGGIQKGQYADLVVLSEDYFTVPEDRIPHIESVLTIVGGKPVYGNAEFESYNPPLPEISPAWSPVRYYGGYQNDDPRLGPAEVIGAVRE